MLRVCSLVLVVHGALANICCLPKQFEGIEAQTTGMVKPNSTVPVLVQTDINVHYDATNQRMALDETVTVNGYTSKVKVIQLWTKLKEYVIQESGKCTKKTLSGNFPEQCVPDIAKDLGKHFAGSAKNRITFHTYEINAAGFHILLDSTPECIPLTQQMSGDLPNGDRMLQVNRYYDIVPGIKDPSVFEVPSSCDQAPITGHQDTSRKILW